jgi:hypothetical protein
MISYYDIARLEILRYEQMRVGETLGCDHGSSLLSVGALTVL